MMLSVGFCVVDNPTSEHYIADYNCIVEKVEAINGLYESLYSSFTEYRTKAEKAELFETYNELYDHLNSGLKDYKSAMNTEEGASMLWTSIVAMQSFLSTSLDVIVGKTSMYKGQEKLKLSHDVYNSCVSRFIEEIKPKLVDDK